MGENRNKKITSENGNDIKSNNQKQDAKCKNNAVTNKTTSLESLVVWNISKALEKNPAIDIQSAIKTALIKLAEGSRDLHSIISQNSEERNLTCAVLAWQQLGHENADSLCRFYKTRKCEEQNKRIAENEKETCTISEFKRESKRCESASKYNISSSYDSLSLGPVVRLPVRTKIVMRVENTSSCRPTAKKEKTSDDEIKNKIDAACCLETECIKRLASVDATTNELRTRAAKLARREAERVELVERAEAAWKDLELGYQRRLMLAEEKEDDLSNQIKRLIEERNGYKSACTNLTQQLKKRSGLAEKERAALKIIDKNVCELACTRLRLSEESARGDALLAENQIRASQLDRDLKFKEEQVRHKLLSIQSEVASARALTHETERAMRAELGALREQITLVSAQLLEEEARNKRIKEKISSLEQEKLGMVEDLEGCKVMCDGHMQRKVDELQKKRVQLNELKDKVMDCRCKLPIDAIVEVKRTASLAALCKCIPEEKILESCSCTSLGSTLLSNLLADLFGGLQAELSGAMTEMPCELLKCLEDRHNWDRASAIKNNLQSFFSRLLIGELDIAIATSIEKYHAKWVGASCADRTKFRLERNKLETEGKQDRLLEQKAQKLASQLAEQLFQDRANQVTQKSKGIAACGSPSCPREQVAVFPCLVKPTRIPKYTKKEGCLSSAVETRSPLKQTLKDVVELKVDIEDLKKNSIKKGDLKPMQENIVKIMQRVTDLDLLHASSIIPNNKWKEGSRHEYRSLKLGSNVSGYLMSQSKHSAPKQKILEIKKKNKNYNNAKSKKDIFCNSYNKTGQAYAVNLCLCGKQNNPENRMQQQKIILNDIEKDDKSGTAKLKPSKATHTSGIEHAIPISTKNVSLGKDNLKNSEVSYQLACTNECCFHKVPSNTSIDKLINTLAKWKCVLTHSIEKHTVVPDLDLQAVKRKEKSLEKITESKCTTGLDNYGSEVEQNFSKKTTDMSCKSVPSNENVCMMSCHENQENITEIDAVVYAVPANTASEYMGAINLDKSNDNSCECMQNNIKADRVSNGSNKNVPYKCINLKDCACKGSVKSVDSKIKVSQGLQEITKKNTNQNFLYNEENNTKKEDNLHKAQNKNSLSYIVNTTNNKNSETYSYDYLIRFLGVTLDNSNINSNKRASYTKHSYHNERPTFIGNCHESYKSIHPIPYNTNVSETGNKIKNNKKVENDLALISKSKSITGEANTNLFKMVPEINRSNADKAVYVTDLTNMVQKPESCVCCNIDSLDESKNLEENAYSLLQEYLKEKFNNFKALSCKSCLSQKEEEKLFTAIFKKIRQVISEHVKEISCNCSKTEQAKESWNRAYGLLQEYLKVKISRAQCLCLSTKNDSNSVKHVLDRVSNLIEHDFQRLKTICKCKEEKNTNEKSPNNILYGEEIPVKDTNEKSIFKTHDNDTRYCAENLNVDGNPIATNNENPCNIMKLNTAKSSIFSNTNNCIERSNKNLRKQISSNILHGDIKNKMTSEIYKPTGVSGNDNQNNYQNCENGHKAAIHNSNKSVIFNESVSCQVPPNLGMVSQYCDGLEIITADMQTTNTELKDAEIHCEPSEFNVDCECCCSFLEQSSDFSEFGRRELLVNQFTGIEKNKKSFVSINSLNAKPSSYSLLDKELNKLPALEKSQNMELKSSCQSKNMVLDVNNLDDKTIPYVGYTVDCPCFERNLSSCICIKSIIAQANNTNIVDICNRCRNIESYVPDISSHNFINKAFNGENCELQKYDDNNKNLEHLNMKKIMEENPNINSPTMTHKSMVNLCDIKVSVHGEEDLVLIKPLEHCEQVHHSTNTSDKNITLVANCPNINNYPVSRYKRFEKHGSQLCLLDGNLKNEIYPLDTYKKKNLEEKYIGKDDNVSLANTSNHDCYCDVVPICHVKMLVENIENRLINCDCTCDSLVSDVCPIHSTKYL